MDLHAPCLVNSYQRKDARVLFRLMNILALDVIQVLDCRNLFSIVLRETQFLACVLLPSLFWTASRWLDSLVYIESITDAYS